MSATSPEDWLNNPGTVRDIRANSISIRTRVIGSGPPLLLLHGYPQTHGIWHRIAPRLAEDFTVVATDLRGYGASDKPPSDAAHRPYSKRVMAADQVAVMEALGFARFAVTGHDRGGRVAHRMARDWPERVAALAVLDIAPTKAMYEATDMGFATGYYHWFFLIQPAPLPETLIGAAADAYLALKLKAWGRTDGAITDAAFAAYRAAFTPEMIHASCEDYRASAGIDLEHDAEDHTPLAMPLLALWGQEGFVGQHYDVLAEWRKCATEVSGHGVPGGHYLPEEAPEETLAALRDFFTNHANAPTEGPPLA